MATSPFRALIRQAALAVASIVLGLGAAAAHAAPRTVCTITVNSPDEKEAMRRHLPKGDYRFVELVEHGRPDWLASACRKQVKCDVLVVSGHFNGHDFFSDKIEASEYLPVAEMERASCSNACPSLFSQLKEVYLFGCTSLSAEAALNPAAEIERTLVRSGIAPAEAQRIAQASAARHGESNRDVMRRVFMNVPAIYGFSAVAPLGPVSGGIIDRYFRANGTRSYGTGAPNRGMLAAFAAHSMTVVPGLRASDPQAAYRGDVCRFVDDRSTAAAKLRFVHEVLRRGDAESRMFLEHIEDFLASLTDAERADPAFVRAKEELVGDADTKARYLDYVRADGDAGVRARMLNVGHALGWLDDAALLAEDARLVGDLLAQPALSTADVALACRLARGGALDGARDRLAAGPAGDRGPARTAVLACLGDPADRADMLAALTSGDEREARAAEVYFAARPIVTAAEFRALVSGIARMQAPEAQVHALDTLARQPLTEAAALAPLVGVFENARSVQVQRAVAGVLIRSDHRALATPELVHVLRTTRQRSPDGPDVIDILIRRMQDGAVTAAAGAPTHRF